MIDLGINLLASVISGLAVWLFTRLGRRRRVERTRAFFGVRPGSRALLVVPRHFASPHALSVNQNDAAAVVDLAAMVLSCGGQTDLVGNDRVPVALGAVPEFCVGGPGVNERAENHLRLLVPGVRFAADDNGSGLTVSVGESAYPAEGDTTYAVLVKVYGPQGGAPVFLICGQNARSNQATARYLTAHQRDLIRRYGSQGRFALLLRLRGVRVYGTDAVDTLEDVTGAAFTEAPAG